MPQHLLPFTERLRSLGAIRRLFDEGQSGFVYPFRYVWYAEADPMPSVEVLFTVPKKFHKRANKRNLLRRRTKEAYRLQKQPLHAAAGVFEALTSSGALVNNEALLQGGVVTNDEMMTSSMLQANDAAQTRDRMPANEGKGSPAGELPEAGSSERTPGTNLDLALIYSSKEVLPYKTIRHAVRKILEQVAEHL